MPLLGFYRLALNFQIPNGTEASVIRHCTNGNVEVDNTEMVAVLAAIEDWWDATGAGASGAKVQFSTGTVLQDVVMTQMTGTPPDEVSASVNIAGTSAGDAPPPESAIVSTWTTGSPGRSFRGRSFWPGYAVLALDGTGLLAPGNVTVWTTIMENLTDAINNAGMALVQHAVYSKTLDVMTPITGTTIRSTPHHQSRRNA